MVLYKQGWESEINKQGVLINGDRSKNYMTKIASQLAVMRRVRGFGHLTALSQITQLLPSWILIPTSWGASPPHPNMLAWHSATGHGLLWHVHGGGLESCPGRRRLVVKIGSTHKVLGTKPMNEWIYQKEKFADFTSRQAKKNVY